VNAKRAAHSPTAALPLRVAAQGVCCPVGNSVPAAVAAMRASLAHFSPTPYHDDANRAISGSSLYEVPLTGRERLRHMYRMAAEECFASLALDDDAPLPPIILLGGERGERETERLDWLLETCRPEGGHDKRTCRMAAGKAGIAAALQRARDILTGPDAPEFVVVIAVDSLLEPEAITPFIESRRILCSTNSDGFVPGEACAAIALTIKPDDQPALWIEGIGTGSEPASPESNDPPLIAKGLTDALRGAISEASAPARDYTFHAPAYSGEQWFCKETSLALCRVMTEAPKEFDTRVICLSLGEVGAASAPMTLIWTGAEMALGILGDRGLLHFSNNDSQRAALAVRYRI